MKYINEDRIEHLLANAGKTVNADIDKILAKTKTLQRLSLEETAALLQVQDPVYIQKIYDAAAYVKETIYGKRVVLFAPLYISNLCANNCEYCAFRADNKQVTRRQLTIDEIKQQTEWLLKRGHKRILVVAGETAFSKNNIQYYTDAIKAIYSVSVGPHKIKRININCAPLSIDEFKQLKESGIGTYQIFQETYHDKTYRQVHISGPKTDPDNRIDAVDRAFTAGIDDVGIGVLYGLYDYRFDTLAMIMHIEELEKKFNVGPHTISIPRIEPAIGSEFSYNPKFKVSDDDFKKVTAVLRLAVPYTGIILSTRETAQMRDELLHLGVSQISAESRTSPGGYSSADNNENTDTQFSIGDQRTLDEVIGSLIAGKMIPSFCAACYRKHRTGETFMNLAKPGTIKGKCSINALITLKEYLDDFASLEVKKEGYQLIDEARKSLDEESQKQIAKFFEDIDKGLRDEFV